MKVCYETTDFMVLVYPVSGTLRTPLLKVSFDGTCGDCQNLLKFGKSLCILWK